MISKLFLLFLGFSLVYMIAGDGWGQLASQGSNNNPPPAEPLVGGPEEMDLNDAKVRNKVYELARFGLQEINKRSNDLYQQTLIRVVKAYSQVVSGIKYHITITSGQSNCRNPPENSGSDQCPLTNSDNARYQQCTMKIWEQSWLNHLELENDFNCKSIDAATAKATSQSQEDVNYAFWPFFVRYMHKYNKTYADKIERNKRYKIFLESMKTARLLRKYEQGTAIYGATIFADWTIEEYSKILMKAKPKNGIRHRGSVDSSEPQSIPESWDWREQNVVTGVKSQGLCGSCWAFSATGNIEGLWAIKKQQLISLSEQQLLDCGTLGDGCGGGSTWNAYKEIIRMGGIESEENYAYEAHRRQCRLNESLEKVYINESIAIPQNEQEMAKYLYNNGPISIGINVLPLMLYMGGIAHPWKVLCSPKMINHAALLVGYGSEGEKPYWLIKNSFGTWWGEKGYLRLYRGAGVCGVDQEPMSVIIY